MAAIFKNKTIVLSGTFSGHTHASLKSLVETHGGTFSAKVTDDCTHLISSAKEFENNGTKNKQAASNNVDVVSVDWLLDSIASKKCKKEADYLWSTLRSSQAAPAPTSNGTTDATPAANPRRSARNSQAQSQSQAQAQSQPQPQSQPQSQSQAKTTKKGNKRTLDATATDTTDTAKADSQPPAKKQKDAQKTPPKKQNILVDALCPNKGKYHVYVDPDGLIYDAALNQTNRMNNNNKFYFIQVLEPNNKSDKYLTWTRWGRVGEDGQTSAFNGLDLKKAIATFEKKFRDKTGLAWKDRFENAKAGKYMFLERDYEETDDESEEQPKKKAKTFGEEDAEEEIEVKTAECTLPLPVQHVVGLIFNQAFWANTMATMDYDANKLPLGKLSKRTLQKGFELLKLLSDMYFTVIPHALGRGRIPLINNEQMIKKEIGLLEALTDMEIANEILKGSKKNNSVDPVHVLDRQFSGLNLKEMEPFERHGETDRYLNSPYANIRNSNRRLLWHGSRTTNFGGILSQGLRIAPPEAPVNGYMFGKGVYFADISSKSANYCCAYNSDNTGLLLLCDVELGNPMLELNNSNSGAAELVKKENKLATLGMGEVIPYGWKDAGCVHEDLAGVLMPDTTGAPRNRDDDDEYRCLRYNEYIVYDVAQIRVKYLFCVGM
ncbi:hypothetical protein UREG_04297 [Uncinocarpus reesii 1704]|uniref:Poly [ADP-ribose] polymerase n=1 Tax=Uncinocarpus reesii (strain UAMH 1704) TaxID=336963 RepID=C4JN91_UNCRE|nr:uncharacterized protein UREG_04297 [Uncinocarpus reesii 1704]EEP79451.1 hypothetical protein UREG_04297 [Uncinocarpus reesii 1704]